MVPGEDAVEPSNRSWSGFVANCSILFAEVTPFERPAAARRRWLRDDRILVALLLAPDPGADAVDAWDAASGPLGSDSWPRTSSPARVGDLRDPWADDR